MGGQGPADQTRRALQRQEGPSGLDAQSFPPPAVLIAACFSRELADYTIQVIDGRVYLNGQPLPNDAMPVSLVLPMGRSGPAFLTYQNFDVYTEWNNSLVYCLTAAYYASRLAGGPPLAKGNGPVSALSLAELKELQQQLAKQGFDVGKIDGVIGAASREAIRTMQVKYGLPADAYPTAELLRRLRTGR